MKTFPREWLGVHNPSTSSSPEDLAKAGFYCGFWIKGKAWVKCHACHAYLYQWPMFRGPVQQQILQQQRQQLKQQQPLKKAMPKKTMLMKKGATTNRRESKVEHQEQPSEEQQQQPLLQKLLLGGEASATTAEIPGVAYLNLTGDGGKLELPMVSHYSQNINCWFVQKTMEDEMEREKTFPEGWSVANNLSVSACDVASAGFIHFPSADRADSELKFAPSYVQRLKCTTSRYLTSLFNQCYTHH